MSNVLYFSPEDTLVIKIGEDCDLSYAREIAKPFQECLQTDNIIVCKEDMVKELIVIKKDNPFLGGLR